jgi:hypothetical protein
VRPIKFLFLLAALLSGCALDSNEDAKEPATIATGLYQLKENLSVDGEFLTITNQIHFEKGAYESGVFFNDVESIQSRGSWILESDSVKITNRTRRETNDAGAWGPWEPTGNGGMRIQNITATSFQDWVDYSDLPADVSIQGAVSGWKTYNRIGD